MPPAGRSCSRPAQAPLCLDTIIETSIDPITVLDSDGRIVRANPAFLNLLSCGPEDILQQEPLLLAFVEEGDP